MSTTTVCYTEAQLNLLRQMAAKLIRDEELDYKKYPEIELETFKQYLKENQIRFTR
jgi:hypothetical protein